MLNIIQRKNLEIPLGIMAVLVLTSFHPLIQILIMRLNIVFIYPLYSITENYEITRKYIFIANSLMSLLGSILFYVSNKMSWKIFSAIFAVLFLLPLMVLIFGFFETKTLFIQNLVAGFAVGLILLIVALLKKNYTEY